MDYGGFIEEGPIGLPSDTYSWATAHYGDYENRVGWTTSLDFPRKLDPPGGEFYDVNGFPCSGDSCDPYSSNGNKWYVRRIRVKMPDGSTHEFRADDKYYHITQQPQLPLTYYSVDGSAMRYVDEGSGQATLHMPDGSRYLMGQGIFIDRNGNRLQHHGGYWTDSLGRQINVPSLHQSLSPTDTTYTLPSLSGGVSTYTFRWRQMSTVLSANQQLLSPGMQNPYSLQTCGALFGNASGTRVGPMSSNCDVFDAIVLSEIELPNGAKYKFYYNEYGEVTKVIYPTGAYERFRYEMVGGLDPVNPPYDQIARGVRERWVSDGTAQSELRWQYNPGYNPTTYSLETIAPDASRTVQIRVRGRGPNQVYGFDDSRTGSVTEERAYSTTNQMLRRTLNSYVMEGPRGGGAHATATRDARLEKSISIIVEPGSNDALMTLSKSEFDWNADLEYFAYLNVKRSKSYGFVTVSKAVAENPANTFATFESYFNSQSPLYISETDYSYDSAYKARGILVRALESRVLNPSNLADVLAKSQFVYDEAGYFDNNYTTTGWVDPGSNLRGNVTTARTWNKDAGTWIESHTMFDNFGNVRKVWDTSGDATRFVETEYDPVYKYAYPTKTKAPAPDPTGVHGTTEGSEVTRVYDFNTGLMTSVTDAHGQTATTEYDNLLRPIRINPPAGGSVSETVYNDTPGNIWVKRRQQIDAANWAESTTYFDNLGRAIKTRTKDLQGDVMLRVLFDSFGRVEKTSNPYRVDAGGNPTETVYWSKVRYDEASRVVETYAPAPDGQTGNSLGTVQFGISTLPGLVGAYTVATDASGRKSRAISGIYGLMRVDEATDKGGTADQDLGMLAAPTQPTFYSYNIKGELTKITQGVQNRHFMYDSLGRLIKVRQPEQTPNPNLTTTGNPDNNQWTAGYTYDVFGNVKSVTDAKNITITNFYDKAGRTTKRTYSDGTPEVLYHYDGKGLPTPPQFSKGALTKVTSSVSEDRFTSFDNHGRLLASQQITDGNVYPFEYKYNLSGGLIEQKYPSGRVVRNFLDADGGLSTVTTKAANGWNKRVISDFDYSATGAVRKVKLGNGLWETAQFNQMQQLTQVGLGTTATNNDLFKIDYEYGELNADGTTVDAAKNIGMIAKTTTTIPTTNFVQTFKYDSINRLTEARETTNSQQNWKQTFGYDRFGNRTQFTQIVGTTQLTINNITHPTIDQTNNRFTTGQGYLYDLNGNLIQDAEGRSFTFNGDDRQTEVRDTTTSSVIGQYSYDGSGARVKKVVPATGETTIFVYDAGGALAAEYSTQTPVPSPTTSYLTTDHLGSPRVITDKTGQVIARRDFMPFGEELGAGVGPRTENLKYSYIGSDRVRQRFTGYEKDDETGLDFAQARTYQNKHGRFTAVDPLLASANGANPQTFNRYTYTGNDPINYTDPSGLSWCNQNGTKNYSYFGGQGSACPDGWTLADENKITVESDTFTSRDGSQTAYKGDVIFLNPDGSLRVIQTASQNQALAQGQSVADGTSTVASGTAAEAAASGAGTTSGGTVPLPTAASGPPMLSLCANGDSCGRSGAAPVRLSEIKGPPLKSVEAIAQMAEWGSIIPGVGTPFAIIAAIVRAGQGDIEAAGDNLVGVIPFGNLRRLNKVVDTVGDLRKAGLKDAHHTIQDAAVKDLPGYNTNRAPGVQLPGPSWEAGTPHNLAGAVQKQRGGGTYGAERRIGYKALRRSGLSKSAARDAISKADAYFGGLGVNKTTATRIPGGRR